jgi:enoyl-CoA hydratase/carnithine racemase
MILDKVQNLTMNEYTAFLQIGNLNQIIFYQAELNKNIDEDKLKALIILCKEEPLQSDISFGQKSELFRWLDNLPIPTIAIADNRCTGHLLEVFLSCDMRLGGTNLQIELPEDEGGSTFQIEERCRLLMGKRKNQFELLESSIINKYIDIDNIENEVKSFLARIIGTKTLYHIKAIKRCFNHYKKLGIGSSQELLLEEESRQCATLIVSEYLRSRL